MTDNENQNQRISKQRQYESKIIQFMTKSGKVQLRKSQNKTLIRKNTLQAELKQIVNDKLKDKNIKIANKEQQNIIKTQTSIKNNKTKQSLQSNKILKSKQPSQLRRKTTLLTSHHNLSLIDNNPQYHQATHQQLLQKIQTKIDIINQKITKQITNEQNQLLNEYEKKLRQKQQLLNKLKKTTNPQMIKEKTIERKQQLRREKQSLIQGNMYYHEKMESVKGELDLLLGSRDQGRQMLRMLVGEGGLEGSGVNYQVTQKKITMNKNQPAYFNNNNNSISNNNNQLQFVQKVLSTYNQTKIFTQQQQSPRSIATDNVTNKSTTNITQQQQYQHSRQLNSSTLPRIPQRQKNISSVVLNKQSFQIEDDNGNNDFYSYRRVKNKFDRVRSIGVFGDNNSQTNNNSIDANMLQKLGLNKQKDSNKTNKQAKISSINRRQRKKKQLFSNNSNNSKELANVNNKNTNNTNNNNTSNLSYTKQYLQQFVVKKLSNQLNYQTKDKYNKMDSYRQHKQQGNSINNNITNNNNNINNNNIKIKKHQQLIQQLQNKIAQLQEQLTIQGLFKKTILQYYNYKHSIKYNHEQRTTTTTTKKLNQNNNNNKKLTTTISNVPYEIQQHQNQQQMTLLEKIQLMQEQEIQNDNNIMSKENYNNEQKQQQICQPQQQFQVNNNNKQETQINYNYNKAVVQLQSNEFDKRTIIDLLFSQVSFKQYLYQLIVQQFTSNNNQQQLQKQQHNNIQSVMDRFNQHRLLL